jgi:uncharacterized protein (TIGR03083 family)
MTGAAHNPVVPSGLRARVLAASAAARQAGQALPSLPPISPVEAFSRAADAMYGMLCALGGDDWRRPVLRDLDVQGLVGHLMGVEEDVHRALAGDPAVAQADHVASTQPAAAAQAGREPAETLGAWRWAASQTLSLAASADPGAEVALHGVRLPVAALLVVRAFETWTHENDIRRAAGLAPSVPDIATLRLMTGLVAQLLPFGAARAGLHEPVSLHLVLTGPGGGTWDLAIGAPGGPSPAPVSIVADAVGFCQLAANRLPAAELDTHVTGDPGRAAAILAATSTLALD